MRKKTILLVSAILYSSFSLWAQVGGTSAYASLNLTLTPRSAALGSKVVTLDEADHGIALFNPAQLSAELDNQLTLSYVSFFADIQYAFVNYSWHYDGIGTFGVGLQQVDYGSFIDADQTGLITGSFKGSDMAFYLSYARSINNLFSVGVNLKSLYSHLEQYTSFGMVLDVGASYKSRDSLFSAAIVARNIGSMIKPYTPHTWEPMPFEILVGASQKLKHAPFRFVATFQQLQTTELFYKRKSTTSSLFGDDEANKSSLVSDIGNEILSHLIIGVEFVPIKNFYIRGGYNFQRRNEMKVLERVSTVGISWGVGVKIKRFYINYSRATYHLAGGSNHFSIGTNINDFFIKKNL